MLPRGYYYKRIISRVCSCDRNRFRVISNNCMPKMAQCHADYQHFLSLSYLFRVSCILLLTCLQARQRQQAHCMEVIRRGWIIHEHRFAGWRAARAAERAMATPCASCQHDELLLIRAMPITKLWWRAIDSGAQHPQLRNCTLAILPYLLSGLRSSYQVDIFHLPSSKRVRTVPSPPSFKGGMVPCFNSGL